MGAIKSHKTPVNTTGSWDGPKAVADASNEAATLRYMHAWMNASGDPAKKSSYKFPHHEPGTDTAAVIAGVNNALARLSQAKIPDGDKVGVEAHLRKHRKDAGLEESMSEAEISEAVKFIKKMDDLKVDEARTLTELVTLQEKSNLAEWLESRLHLSLTQIADDMFGSGTLTRDERKILSGAIGGALDTFHQFMLDNAPQLFVRRPWEDAPEPDSGSPITESAVVDLNEAAIPLDEKAVRNDGTVPLKIIQPGWGSSGFYPVEVLKRDGAKAFPKGTKMNWNHPTPMEESDRPEGDLNDMASELVTDARWMDKGPKGAGLYADAKVFEAYQGAVNDLAPHIGVSIHARGKGMQGEMEGKQGVIVQEIMESPFNRVDYVTMPGAGGEIISLFEAARTPPIPNPSVEGKGAKKNESGTVPGTAAAEAVSAQEKATNNVANNNKENDMDVKELQEKVATLETNGQALATDNARLKEAMALRDAKEMVREALGSLSSLPDVTKARLVESLAKNPPIKDGTLDREAFAKAIEEAVKAEVKYLEKVAGIGRIRGLGESDDGDDEDDEIGKKVEESLLESFSALGLSEAGAKSAAKGRG